MDELEALRREYASEIPEKAGALSRELETVVHELGQRPSPTRSESFGRATTWDELGRLAHKLAGSSGTYGFAPLSRLCQLLEDAIVEGTLPALAPKEAAAFLRLWLAAFAAEAQAAATLRPEALANDRGGKLLKPLRALLRKERAA